MSAALVDHQAENQILKKAFQQEMAAGSTGTTSTQAGSFQKFEESNWNKMTTQVSKLNQLN